MLSFHEWHVYSKLQEAAVQFGKAFVEGEILRKPSLL